MEPEDCKHWRLAICLVHRQFVFNSVCPAFSRPGWRFPARRAVPGKTPHKVPETLPGALRFRGGRTDCAGHPQTPVARACTSQTAGHHPDEERGPSVKRAISADIECTESDRNGAPEAESARGPPASTKARARNAARSHGGSRCGAPGHACCERELPKCPEQRWKNRLP